MRQGPNSDFGIQVVEMINLVDDLEKDGSKDVIWQPTDNRYDTLMLPNGLFVFILLVSEHFSQEVELLDVRGEVEKLPRCLLEVSFYLPEF